MKQKVPDLTTIRNTLRVAISGECVDLLDCVSTPACPLPISEVFTSERTTGHRDRHRADETGSL